MALEQQKVREIVMQAVSKNVDIPEFQREFIWDADQVKDLAESLYRDYPIGSFLLWDYSDYEQSKTAQGAQASLWIVDGQQRTTALCLLLGQKPYWWDNADKWNKALEHNDVMVNLVPDDDNDQLEFGLPNPIRRMDPRWISLRGILRVQNVEALTGIAHNTTQRVAAHLGIATSDQFPLFSKVHARLQSLWQIRERDVPIIKIQHEVEDVAEIFSRLNQAGTRVKEADVVLALAAVQNPGWVREDYLPFRNNLEERGWDLDAGIYIRAMTGIGRGRARLIEVPKDFCKPESLKPVWKSTEATMSDVLKHLADYGITSAELLPSTNSLIPLFVLHSRWHTAPNYDFRRAFRWFLLANRDGRYSGSAITSLNEDVRAINEAVSFDQALESLKKRLRISAEIGEDEFLVRYNRSGNRFLRLMLYLVLFDRGARDWVDRIRLGYDKTGGPMTSGFEPQWHHIFPRSVLKAHQIKEDDINALANLTVLNERTNVSKLSAKEPWEYIVKFGIDEILLREHLIPEPFASHRTAEYWSVANHPDFLLEWSKLLAQESNRFLQELEQIAAFRLRPVAMSWHWRAQRGTGFTDAS